MVITVAREPRPMQTEVKRLAVVAGDPGLQNQGLAADARTAGRRMRAEQGSGQQEPQPTPPVTVHDKGF